jgi:hypothetical protein
MSIAFRNASRLKPEIRLAQAVSEFRAILSSQQKTTLRTYESQAQSCPPGPIDVMRITAELDRNTAGKTAGKCFGTRLTNFLQAVQQFAALGDVVVGGSQNILACGIWSLVRMTLLIRISVPTPQALRVLMKCSVARQLLDISRQVIDPTYGSRPFGPSLHYHGLALPEISPLAVIPFRVLHSGSPSLSDCRQILAEVDTDAICVKLERW